MIGYLYIIRNKVNGKFYLGSTKNKRKRKLRHFNELRKGQHHSTYLQRAFTKYGEESFEFILIETCYDYTEREQFLLDNVIEFNNSYNISRSASGGDLISNHPNKERIIQKAIENLKNAPLRTISYKRDKNPNWRGGKTFCKCGNRIASKAKSCIKCQDKNGCNNPFFGKTHSDKTKEIIKKSRQGKYFGNQEREVIINGENYKSISEASRKLEVSPATILYRIKSNSKKFINYLYK
jgi:group I intron endonuclease